MTTPLPAWFTARDDPRPDDGFYAFPRLVTPIDAAAIRAVGDLYAELCCVSVDYLTRPVEVLADVARVLRPGAPVVLTFSNRFLGDSRHRQQSDQGGARPACDRRRRPGRHRRGVPAPGRGFDPAEVSLRTPSDRAYRGDPLGAVVARAR